MSGHIIVCGDDALGMRIVEELKNAGARVVTLQTPDGLTGAGIADAQAVICADDDDALNLEIALLARQANPDVRVVARLANGVLREAMAQDNGPGAILDVADMAASSVVEACLSRTTHTISVAGIDFVVSGADAPRAARLRDIFGDLAPVAVIHDEGSEKRGEVVACPGRDYHVNAGDWTSMIGTADELADQGIAIPRPLSHSRARRPPLRRVIDAVRLIRDDINPMFYRALAVSLSLLIGSTVLLRFAYRHPPGMSWIDALYFSTETIATVGYGDFSFMHQPLWLRIWGIGLMFAGVTTTAILVAFIADVLLSRRMAQSAGRRKVRHLRRPRHRRRPRLLWHPSGERSDSGGLRRGRHRARRCQPLSVHRRPPRRARDLRRCHAAPNTGVRTHRRCARGRGPDAGRHGQHRNRHRAEGDARAAHPAEINRPDVPIVLRVYDRTLGAAVAQRFGFENVLSTVDLATPWFIGAALGLQVLGTFSVGQRSFMVGGMYVKLGSELDGMRMFDLSTQTRVIAITRPGAAVRLHPRRDARLSAGDTAYLVGPYRELLDTLRKGQGVQQPDVSTGPATTG